MKKIFLLLTVFTMVFTSCEPLEDINEQIDAQENAIVGDVAFVMSDEDYDALDLSFGNFSSEDDAKEMIPELLTSKYPVLGNQSSALVTYKLYSKKNDEKSLEVYKVTSADYTAGGHTYGNFSSYSDIIDFLDTKYPSPANRLLVSLTYKYYSGSVATLNNGFLFNNGQWEMITGFTNDEYNTMGESYPNFSNEDEALEKIPVFLKDKFKYEGKSDGDIEAIMYKLYVGGGKTNSYVVYFIFNGSDWVKYENTINKTIQFGHDGLTWVPDNTIKYTLTTADYALVGNDRYNNFDVRSGKDEFEESVRLAKINTILLNNFPADSEGQKYIVSYDVYNGSNAVWTLAVVKVDAEYVKQ